MKWRHATIHFGRRSSCDLLGCKVWGFIADECYASMVYGLMLGRRGLFLCVPFHNPDVMEKIEGRRSRSAGFDG